MNIGGTDPAAVGAPPSAVPLARVSVLIVNWNSKDYVRDCLRSLENERSGLISEVIVVDGGSFDGCWEMLAAEFPWVRFLQCEHNFGFGYANNRGFELVLSELVLLLNPDTELRPGALPRLVDVLLGLRDCGLAGPRILNTDGSLQTSCVCAFPGPLNRVLGSEFLHRLVPGWRLWGNRRAFESREPVPVDAVSGACMLLHSETFRQLGGFSPDYFMYGEDMDLCARIERLGLRVYHVPAAEVLHHGGGCSARETSRFSAVLLRESTFRFISTHRGRFAAIRYRVLIGLSAGVRIVVTGCLLPLVWSARRASLAATCSKWVAVLRWCLGMERWAARKSDQVAAIARSAGRAAS